MSIRPVISVLLPFYNSGQFLSVAISSILGQTFNDFELLLLNDGSTDDLGFLSPFLKDYRIRCLHSERNLGLSKQLNIGLAEARGTYIARIDADDIAKPNRFKKQYLFLEKNPNIGICGSYAQRFDRQGDRDIWKYPIASDEVHANLFFKSSFLHPGVLMRARIFHDNPSLRYDETLIVAQDYMLWHEMLKCTKGANLAECLTLYRISDEQLTTSKSDIKNAEGRHIRLRMLHDLGLTPSDAEQTFHNIIFDGKWEETTEFFESTAQWLETLYQANERSSLFPRFAFASLLAKYFFFQCQYATRRSFDGMRFYENLNFSRFYAPPFWGKLRMRYKSLLKT